MKEKFRMLFDEKLWKFLLVGVLNTLVGNGLMFLLYNLAGFSYWPATGLSYALASVMSYFLNRYFTFKYQGSGWGTALRFALNIAVCYGLAYGPQAGPGTPSVGCKAAFHRPLSANDSCHIDNYSCQFQNNIDKESCQGKK